MYGVTAQARLSGDGSTSEALPVEFHHGLGAFVSLSASRPTKGLGARERLPRSCLSVSFFLLHCLLHGPPSVARLTYGGAFALRSRGEALAVAVQQPWQRVSPMGDHVGAISNRKSIWGSLPGSFRRATGTITTHHLDTEGLASPRCEGLRFPIR